MPVSTVGFAGSIQSVVDVEGLGELLLDDVIGDVAGRTVSIVSCFTGSVAFGVKTIVDMIAQSR
jgi:hypothetical protein